MTINRMVLTFTLELPYLRNLRKPLPGPYAQRFRWDGLSQVLGFMPLAISSHSWVGT